MTRLATAALAVTTALSAAGAAHAQADWTGPYVGAHLGGTFRSDEGGERVNFDRDLNGAFNDTIVTSGGADAFSPGFCGGAANGNNAGAGCRDDDERGFEYGVRAGWDWRLGGLIVGVVGEYGKTEVEDSVTAFSVTPAAYTFNREVDWIAALRGRVGGEIGSYLVYGTAGVVKAGVDRSFTTTNTVNTFTTRGDDDADGWQWGLGTERHINDKVTIGLEYLYTKIEDEDYTVRAAGPAPATNPFILGNANGADLRRSEDELGFHSVRLTANFRF